MRGLDIPFEVRTKATDETYPKNLDAREVPEYIANLKADAFTDLKEEDILVTADTVVIADGKIFGKPHTKEEATEMLKTLQDRTHIVVTGVSIRKGKQRVSFSDTTKVHFSPLTDKEIESYIERYKPFDKAGAYGVQEWIGYVAVDRLEGSYFNVVGLPIHRVYQELKKLI